MKDKIQNFNPAKESAYSSMQVVENGGAIAATAVGQVVGGINNAAGGALESFVETPDNPDAAIIDWASKRSKTMPINK